ncbi:MAG: DUF3604 domain-containing protein [Sinobacteraceae bacterium]|nr:DUF3604 domain-containing protein [Nevskiaceae bacterium]
MRTSVRLLLGAACAALLLSACGRSAPVASGGTAAGAVRCPDYNPQRNPYFGDLHVHTTYSLDANVRGTLTDARDAYRFAEGQRIGLPPYDAQGNPLRTAQLARPLDFAADTDHAEFFGETRICTDPQQAGYQSPECLLYRIAPDQSFLIFNSLLALPGLPQLDGTTAVPRLPYCGLGGERCLAAAQSVWSDVQQAAAQFDDACRFTTFVAYEWTGSPGSKNLHRNVIFANGNVPPLPVSYLDAANPESLWQKLDAECRAQDGCDYLTIPHNSDLSGGLMFTTRENNGQGADFTPQYAYEKQIHEPLIEIFQHKGSSECNHSVGLGAQDELCDFENLPYDNLTADRFDRLASGQPQEGDFVRYGLEEGLLQEQKLGVNPFKYGFIADTDTHVSTPGNVAESSFPGHGGDGKPPSDAVDGLADYVEYNPGGLAVLWAEQNTRESLFRAMARREAYGTSGPRMVVRFFGGWELPQNQCDAGDFAAVGYAHGVPMGGDLPAAPDARAAPSFAVAALRDPGGDGDPSVPLQRIQIVKGWIDAGQKREAVYDVAGDPNDGASVDLSDCRPQGRGFSNLCTVWRDPNFDPRQPAFYYARVVQNPSCRWSTYQCLAAHIDCSDPKNVPGGYQDCCNADYPKTVQERAWTSPIWYHPGGPLPASP